MASAMRQYFGRKTFFEFLEDHTGTSFRDVLRQAASNASVPRTAHRASTAGSKPGAE